MGLTNKERHALYDARYPGKKKAGLYAIQQRNIAINRPYLLEYKQTHPCANCGESRIDCLVFHHLGDKDKEVGKCLRSSHHLMVAEVEKCIVLCANCHQILHAEERRGRSIHEWREMQPGHDDPVRFSNQLSLFDSSTSAY